MPEEQPTTKTDLRPTDAELFARDPLQYTQQDLDQLIERYREARKQFALGKKVEPKKNVNLADLGLL